jgi:cell wall-associated NlpC family hydrolase
VVLSKKLSDRIVTVSQSYLGRPFDWDTFNCVHYVRSVYHNVGITLPELVRLMLPPSEFNLSPDELVSMPLGHSVFLKRKAKVTRRPWSHVVIIVGPDKFIHCTRHMGDGVIISSKDELLEIYDLVPKTFE